MILPEAEWGAVLLFIPFSLFLIAFPFYLSKRAKVRAKLFHAIVIVAFFAGIYSYLQQDTSAGITSVTSTALLTAVVLIASIMVFPDRTRWQLASVPLILGVASASASMFLKLAFLGWLGIAEIGTGFIAATSIFHTSLRAIYLAGVPLPPRKRLMFASDILLVAAALMRWDVGDGEPWLNVLELSKHIGGPDVNLPEWFNEFMDIATIAYAILLYLPVAYFWHAMIRQLLSRSKEPFRK